MLTDIKVLYPPSLILKIFLGRTIHYCNGHVSTIFWSSALVILLFCTLLSSSAGFSDVLNNQICIISWLLCDWRAEKIEIISRFRFSVASLLRCRKNCLESGKQCNAIGHSKRTSKYLRNLNEQSKASKNAYRSLTNSWTDHLFRFPACIFQHMSLSWLVN